MLICEGGNSFDKLSMSCNKCRYPGTSWAFLRIYTSFIGFCCAIARSANITFDLTQSLNYLALNILMLLKKHTGLTETF